MIGCGRVAWCGWVGSDWIGLGLGGEARALLVSTLAVRVRGLGGGGGVAHLLNVGLSLGAMAGLCCTGEGSADEQVTCVERQQGVPYLLHCVNVQDDLAERWAGGRKSCRAESRQRGTTWASCHVRA